MPSKSACKPVSIGESSWEEKCIPTQCVGGVNTRYIFHLCCVLKWPIMSYTPSNVCLLSTCTETFPDLFKKTMAKESKVIESIKNNKARSKQCIHYSTHSTLIKISGTNKTTI